VAYLRFASVYQGFDSLEDFEAAITLLRAEHEAAARSAEATAQEAATGETGGPGALTGETAPATTEVPGTGGGRPSSAG
jgi:transcriptional repressor NrdR